MIYLHYSFLFMDLHIMVDVEYNRSKQLKELYHGCNIMSHSSKYYLVIKIVI